MAKLSKPRFMRHFVGGFVIGAVAVVGMQVAQAEPAAPMVAAIEAAR